MEGSHISEELKRIGDWLQAVHSKQTSIEDSLKSLHRKVDLIVTQSAATEATSAQILAEEQTLQQQFTAYNADVVTGLAKVVAALTQPDPNLAAALSGLQAMGTSIAGGQSAFDDAVAAAIPSEPVTPPTPPVAPPTSGTTETTTNTPSDPVADPIPTTTDPAATTEPTEEPPATS